MEFKFNINELFKSPIVEITNNLVPPGFQGDRRQLWDVVNKVSEVVNTVGEASATAQGLSKPITSSDRLKNADNQRLYLLVDRAAKNGKGAITGMLKTGKKGLYVFDREGQHFQVQPNCVLDFYIHESRQRTGLGKHLFEHMLQKEEVDPVKLAIDRPSDKFLAFLNKHYNLNSVVRQMNNFVVFDGFFPEQNVSNNNTDSPSRSSTTKRGSNGLQQQVATSPYGRYGAPRPPCSMGQIIHNQASSVGPQEPSGCSLNSKPEIDRRDFTTSITKTKSNCPSFINVTSNPKEYASPVNNVALLEHSSPRSDNTTSTDDAITEPEQQQPPEDTSAASLAAAAKLERPRSLSLVNDVDNANNGSTQQHVVTRGAVTVDNIIDEPIHQRTDVHPLEQTGGDTLKKTPSHLTDQGYFDLKFYHNKLW